jgi:hypothetical protein
MLQFISLERRECPAFLGSRDGWIIATDSEDFIPFDDFRAAHAVAGDQFTTVTGAAAGGGPRVQVRDGGIVTADFFAYEQSFRDGVNVAYDRGIVVTGAAPGGGPVVAVFDSDGNEISRFFAYDPDFRGGISVAIVGETIYTVPGPGGGPHVRTFDLHGVPLADFFGAESGRRDGWEIIVGDVTHDRSPDVVLINPLGQVDINEGVTSGRQTVQLPTGYTRAGYEGETMTVGNETNYLRGRALWTSFDMMTVFDETDGAAGNPDLPATTGTRPGVYRPIGIAGGPPPKWGDFQTFAEIDISGSVGTSPVGTGSSYIPMRDASGNEYVVTASHVARRSPFETVGRLPSLLAPGRLDGVPLLAGTPSAVSTIQPGIPYVVDAAAFHLADGVTLSNRVEFGDQSFMLDGVAGELQPGEVLIAIGRGRFVGVGQVDGFQEEPVPIRWPSGETPAIADQIIGIRGAVSLAEPGFSGGTAIRLSWAPTGVVRELVGMVVAGNTTYVFITPHAEIEAALGMSAMIV